MAGYVEARCPLRPDDRCSLCQPGADGPHNCGLVYLALHDDELRALYAAQTRRAADIRRREG